MDKRRSPNPKLRLATLVCVVLVAFLMIFTASQSAAHNELVRPRIELSSLPREIAMDVAASDAIYVSPADQHAAIERIRKSKQPLFCGGTKKYAAISFDDGPSATSQQLIKLLKDEGIPATWFDLGRNAESEPAKLKEQAAFGPIGNHSWDHSAFTTLSGKDIKVQLDDTQTTIRQTTGQNWKMMRPPYGARNDETQRTVRKLGYAEILWSSDSQDALGKTWREIAESAINGLGPGAMILFHDGPAATITALKKKFIPAVKRGDITLVTVPDLLALNPPSDQQLEDGPMGCKHAGKVNVSGVGSGGYLPNPESR
jgi:peptidoglycan/xylan/chitin deacetylase (PgdA/CDA1 family)